MSVIARDLIVVGTLPQIKTVRYKLRAFHAGDGWIGEETTTLRETVGTVLLASRFLGAHSSIMLRTIMIFDAAESIGVLNVPKIIKKPAAVKAP